MNSNKLCFIICSNHEVFLEECVHYIRHLTVPKGYEMDLLIVKDAPSITCAYQTAMEQSDAKYKIYMHQDVFILNKRFLTDILSIFSDDPAIGMIGMVGYETVAADGIMWHEKRFGALYQRAEAEIYTDYQSYRYSILADGYGYAAVADGFLLATAYDLPWNTEELADFDFYDAFQCIEFLKKGYKIAIPVQKNPWCLHDDGQVLDLSKYDKYRQLFMEKYRCFLGKKYFQIREEKNSVS